MSDIIEARIYMINVWDYSHGSNICVKYIANDQHTVASHAKVMVWHQKDKFSFINLDGELAYGGRHVLRVG